MKPILTIVGPEASDIYDLLNINGDENVSICITQDNIREYLEIVDATDEIHHISTENITVYIHEKEILRFRTRRTLFSKKTKTSTAGSTLKRTLMEKKN